MTIERGTTQEITVTIRGWDLTGSDIYVTFKQGSKSVTKKELDSVTFSNNATKIVLTLSQQETMSFDNNRAGLVQARWLDAQGIARKTKTAPFEVDDLLYEAVLTKDDDGGD
jgi:hypothetical protein